MGVIEIAVGGIISLAGFVITAYSALQMSHKTVMEEMKTTPIGSARRGYVELKGIAQALLPLKTPVSKTPAVYYKYTEIEEYEQEVENKPEKKTRVIESYEKRQAFYIADESGKIKVDPFECDIKGRVIHTDYRGVDDGAAALGLASELLTDRGRKTLGYRETEEGIAVGDPLYILGTVVNRDNDLWVVRPETKEFVITTKTEREVVKKKEGSKLLLLGFGLLVLIVGIAILFLSLTVL